MTENAKRFLEEASRDTRFLEKLSMAETPETVIALAAEKGFALTEEDMKPEKPAVGALSDDELDAVAGGKDCFCFAGGGGTGSDGQKTCACVAYGQGDMESGAMRCLCPAIGSGNERPYDF